jgi:DNA-directed RNA polymerase specialized sigma subunit
MVGGDQNWTERQRKQVNKLVACELEFRRALKKHKLGEAAYLAFVEYILNDRRNILAARPYFRERQTEFSEGISLAIKNKEIKKLFKFDINYPFISFVLKAINFPPDSRVAEAAQEVYKIRKEIIELNMPLAISRARIFRGKTPESHLEYMDLVQISMEGLINAVDKFVLPYSPVFRSVIIGRITGDLIEGNSETLLHFWPLDKRKIYRANKSLNKNKRNSLNGEGNFDQLSQDVNTGPKLSSPTNPAEIQQLISAATGVLSLDVDIQQMGDGREMGNDGSLMDRFAAPEDTQPDVRYERTELSHVLYNAIETLSKFEIKFLKLKGIFS